MGEGLSNYVRIEESHRALRSLQGQIAEWADRRCAVRSMCGRCHRTFSTPG
jgi:hypothetical protein